MPEQNGSVIRVYKVTGTVSAWWSSGTRFVIRKDSELHLLPGGTWRLPNVERDVMIKSDHLHLLENTGMTLSIKEP